MNGFVVAKERQRLKQSPYMLVERSLRALRRRKIRHCDGATATEAISLYISNS